jgi:hypothetical protein
MFDNALVQSVIIFGCGVLAITFLFVGMRLWLTDKGEYDRNYERIGSFLDAIRGRVGTWHNGARHFRVNAGLAIDTQSNEWIEQGAISEEAIDAVLKP